MLWRHHWKSKQMLYAVLNWWGVRQGRSSLYRCTGCRVNEQHEQQTYRGVRQGAACIGAQFVVLMSSANSELTVV